MYCFHHSNWKKNCLDFQLPWAKAELKNGPVCIGLLNKLSVYIHSTAFFSYGGEGVVFIFRESIPDRQWLVGNFVVEIPLRQQKLPQMPIHLTCWAHKKKTWNINRAKNWRWKEFQVFCSHLLLYFPDVSDRILQGGSFAWLPLTYLFFWYLISCVLI